MTATAYPLCWPKGRPRTKSEYRSKRRVGRGTLYTVIKDLQRELRLLGALRVVFSTNVELRLDGLPRSGGAMPEDPGVALYFETFTLAAGSRSFVVAVDRFARVTDNAAIILTLIRGLRVVDKADIGGVFDGALQELVLPRTWRRVLGYQEGSMPNIVDVRNNYLERARTNHPDKGGSHAVMVELNNAYDEARREYSKKVAHS